MLSDAAARWLLVLHTALGVAAVGAATHLVIWLRDFRRGNFARTKAVRRFAWIAFALHAGGFVVGNLMYPTYRVEVRAAYLDNGNAVAQAHARRGEVLAKIDPGLEQAPTDEVVRRAAQQSRWFDVKEHWVALGLIGSAALALILALWDPRRDGAALVLPVYALAIVVAGTLWLAAIIGVMTASFRAI